jgi:hypothetical protein
MMLFSRESNYFKVLRRNYNFQCYQQELSFLHHVIWERNLYAVIQYLFFDIFRHWSYLTQSTVLIMDITCCIWSPSSVRHRYLNNLMFYEAWQHCLGRSLLRAILTAVSLVHNLIPTYICGVYGRLSMMIGSLTAQLMIFVRVYLHQLFG